MTLKTQMQIIEDMAFNLLESGHSLEAVQGYEVQYILGYMTKRVEVAKAQQATREQQAPPARTQSGRGTKTVRTVMTAQQVAEKARRQNRS